MPYPSNNHTSVTINTLTAVQYQFDQGSWQQAVATDGVFDEVSEDYHFTVNSLFPGWHTLTVTAFDSAGNISAAQATETIALLDPVDGGLNTELYPPTNSLTQQAISLNGLAYHMQGNPITTVKYRIDGGAWQPAQAQDGAFDSSYEPFTLPLNLPETKTYLIEAFAVDANGQFEINFASQEIQVMSYQPSTIFLPIVFSKQ
jgi:hypothetical protein